MRLVIKTTISLVLILLVLYISFALYARFAEEKERVSEKGNIRPDTTVLVLPLKKQDYQEKFSGYARAKAIQQTEVRAEITGLIVWVSPNLRVGQKVKENEVLAKIEDRELKEDIRMAQAELNATKILKKKANIQLNNIDQQLPLLEESLKVSKRQLTRIKRVDSTKKAADEQYLQITNWQEKILGLKGDKEVIKVRKEEIDAEIKRLELLLEKAKKDLERIEIKVPYDGKIDKIFIQQGSFVTPGSSVFLVIDIAKVELSIALGASHFNETKEKAKIEVKQFASAPTLWQGNVQRISAKVDPESRTFKVYSEIIDESGKSPIPPGSVVYAQVDGNLYQNIFVLPRIAFDYNRVFIAKPLPNTKEMVVFESFPHIIRQYSDVVLVDKGISEGDLLIYTNLDDIAKGSKVIGIEKEKAQ